MKVAVFTGSRNLYHNMIPAIKSLLLNSDVQKIYLLIEDDKFPEYLPECVQVINVSDQKFFRKNGPNMNSRFTYLAMMRAALAKMFPDLDKILSLDVDIIVNKNISSLWNLPIQNYYFAAAREPLRSTGGKYYTCPLYTNTGIALYNLKKLREDKKVDEVIFKLNQHPYNFLEQDVFNLSCQGSIAIMQPEYNANEWVEPCREEPKIIHFAGIPTNIWEKNELVKKYTNIPWEEIKP